MNRFISRLEQLAKSIATGFALIAAASAILLTFVVTYGVVLRFLFNSPQIWTDELATYFLAVIVFFGLGYALVVGGHIRVEILTGLFPDPLRRSVEIVTHLIGLIFCALLVYSSYRVVYNLFRRGTKSIAGMDIPLYLPASVLVIGSLAMLLVMLVHTLRCVWPAAPEADRADAADAR